MLQDFPSRVKRPECEADHPSPSGAEFKNVLNYTYIPPYIFMAWFLIKSRENLTKL
jgi:hypothetical protein